MITNIDRETKYDIIIVAGQSNAEGYGKGETAFFPREDIMMMTGKFDAKVQQTEYGNDYLELSVTEEYTISQADERQGDDGKRGVIALSFAEKYAEKYLSNGRKLLLVQTSIGGTGFAKNHWGDGDILSERLYKMVDEALLMNEQNRVVAIAWHQGEHDSFEKEELTDRERYDFYYEKLKFFLGKLREKYGKIPFISAGFTKQWVDSYPTRCEAVYSASEKVCAEDGKATFIRKTDDLKSNDQLFGDKDVVHYSKQACKILGERYFDEYEKLI